MENAAVYARYSSHNQSEQSIEGQLAAAKAYAEQHDYTIVKEYVDRAKTGTNDNRDAFQKMLKESASGKYSVVIVWKVDRFGRNREEIAFNKYKLKKNKVRVEYIAENISKGPEGVILESVLEGMAEYYSLQLSQNIKRGKLESAKKHRVINGQCPLGYRIGQDMKLELDPVGSAAVMDIFERYSQGMTLTELMTYLNSKGYKTARGHEFTKNSLPRILTNEVYRGVYKYKDLIYDENAVPRIVSDELFFKVQEKMRENKRMPSHKWSYSDYLLTGKVFCGLCDSTLIGVSGIGKLGKKYGYYYCSRYRRNKCALKPIRKEIFEHDILEVIYDLVHDHFNELVDAIWHYYLDRANENNELEVLETKQNQIKGRIIKLVKALEDGVDSSIIKPRIDELMAEQKQVENAILTLQRSNDRLTRKQIESYLQAIISGDIQNRAVQRRLIETYIKKIVVYPDKIQIFLNFGNPANTEIPIKYNEEDGVRLCLPHWSKANKSRTLQVWNKCLVISFSLSPR